MSKRKRTFETKEQSHVSFQNHGDTYEPVQLANDLHLSTPISYKQNSIENDSSRTNENLTGLLSVSDEHYRWNLFRFTLNLKRKVLFSEEANMMFDLSNKFEVKRTTGLWPGFELRVPPPFTSHHLERGFVFHGESQEEIDQWIEHFEIIESEWV